MTPTYVLYWTLIMAGFGAGCLLFAVTVLVLLLAIYRRIGRG